ncbi:MAG: 30S ribosome-binding factor RbfA [Desulfobacteraceae bacterium]|nr:30S ribosome-binding factor RbfA [Desulfobacteraceae bacterium]
MKPFSRSDRVGGLIQKVLSELLRKDIHDPRIANATITGVKMSRDLRIAKIYYSIFGDEKSRQDAADGFESARGFVKRSLAQELGLRYMPDVRFFYDESFEYGARIEKLIKGIKSEDETNS